MLFFLLTYMKHIDDHDAVIRAVNTSDFQAVSVTDTFKSPDKTDDYTKVFCVRFIVSKKIGPYTFVSRAVIYFFFID